MVQVHSPLPLFKLFIVYGELFSYLIAEVIVLKKILQVLSILMTILLLFSYAYAYESDIKIYCDGVLLQTDSPPVLASDRTFVPIRHVMTAFGADVKWVERLREVIVTKSDTTIRLSVDKNTAWINGAPIYVDSAPFIVNDRVMVPLRLIAENLEYEVTYDENTREIKINTPQKQKIYYSVKDGIADVAAKYSKSQNIIFTFSQHAPNYIYDFSDIELVYNPSPYVTPSRNGMCFLYTASTDWHSPFMVLADKSDDGDWKFEHHFTGGFHGYTNKAQGTATARTKSFAFYADGAELPQIQEGYCSEFTITWTNAVQGSNTKKQDGSGREIMEERHTLTFDGERWLSSVTLFALEDITIERVYGFQAVLSPAWGSEIIYSTLPDQKFTAGTESNSENKNTPAVRCSDESNVLEISLDTDYGIGNRVYCSDNVPGIFTTSYNKLYFNIVNGIPLSMLQGTEISYRGTYCFYPREY